MKLVLDTNILVAALIKDSVTREILVHPDIEFLLPEFALEELETHKAEILIKSKLSEHQFALLFEQLKSNISITPSEEICCKEEAKNIMDIIDSEDTIFIALALSVENEGIWSQDKHFQRQNKVRVFTTKQLTERLGIEH